VSLTTVLALLDVAYTAHDLLRWGREDAGQGRGPIASAVAVVFDEHEAQEEEMKQAWEAGGGQFSNFLIGVKRLPSLASTDTTQVSIHLPQECNSKIPTPRFYSGQGITGGHR
jgi:hypothetical protein